jgi:hypothetical protein
LNFSLQPDLISLAINETGSKKNRQSNKHP